jgi:hypothetical protein
VRRRIAVAAAGVGLLACGGETDRIGEAEQGIASALGERLGDDAGEVEVTCPDDAVLDPGATLGCEVAIGGGAPQPVPFAIGEAGAVRPAAAVIPTAAVERYLAAELATAAETDIQADCGEASLVVHDVGESFVCTVVRSSDAARFDVTVEVRSLDGSVAYTVAATTTTAATAPVVDPAATTVPP